MFIFNYICYNWLMQLPEEELINDYLNGEVIDPCEHDQFDLEKLGEFLGEDT